MRVRNLRIIGHLTSTSLTTKLQNVFVHLTQTRCANRLAVRQATTIGVHRELATDLGIASLNHELLFTVFTESVFGHMHHFGTSLGVLQLGNVDVFWSDASHFESGL